MSGSTTRFAWLATRHLKQIPTLAALVRDGACRGPLYRLTTTNTAALLAGSFGRRRSRIRQDTNERDPVAACREAAWLDAGVELALERRIADARLEADRHVTHPNADDRRRAAGVGPAREKAQCEAPIVNRHAFPDPDLDSIAECGAWRLSHRVARGSTRPGRGYRRTGARGDEDDHHGENCRSSSHELHNDRGDSVSRLATARPAEPPVQPRRHGSATVLTQDGESSGRRLHDASSKIYGRRFGAETMRRALSAPRSCTIQKRASS
jgi:hypothetical protein